MPAILRTAQPKDRSQVFEVEVKSTPKLSYLPHVFDLFVSDDRGEFIVAEEDHQLVGCGKFTCLPDGTAWLETLRVIPEKQGRGIGKLFYQRFLEIARSKNISTLRLYTGVKNLTSKGLAERFGFTVAGTYRLFKRPCQPGSLASTPGGFHPVTDPLQAADLLLPFREPWQGFLVFNRTFYAITPALAAFLASQGLANQGQLYHDPAAGSTVVLGARFMPWQALHIGVLGGNIAACLAFALQVGMHTGAESLSCCVPASAQALQAELSRYNFQAEASDMIIMEHNLPL